MTKLIQFLEKIKETNPEIFCKVSPTKEYAILIDEYGNEVLVTNKHGKLIFTGTNKMEPFRFLADDYRDVISLTNKKLIYSKTPLDSGMRYDPTVVSDKFMGRLRKKDKIEKFIEQIDDDSYVKELNESISDILVFGRWKLDRNLPHHRDKFNMVGAKTFTIDTRTNNKKDLLFMWYVLSLRLSDSFNLAEELGCLFGQIDENRAQQLKELVKDWNLTDF